MEELDDIFTQLIKEEDFYKIKDNFDKLGIDVFYRNKGSEIKLKPLNKLFEELSNKWEEIKYNE